MFKRLGVLLFVASLLTTLCFAQWTSLGPEGGDARALAFDPSNPDRMLLGTSAGQLFVTNDGGRTWKASVHFGDGDDYVLDNIAFDRSNPSIVYVAAWSVEQTNGDLFKSTDGGKTWKPVAGMRTKSIRAFAVSDNDPKILVVGALDGVFRSKDRGEHWEKITPENHPDLKNFESLAIDRKNPDIIYAGTWHLPWKTTDGGKTWHNIKNGVIDDSDVFSIIIDHSNPDVVYASACSGIYRSDNAGEQFRKIQGIPGSARRTRVLQQDPRNPSVVWAGTTEGLWKTTDGGKVFKRMSPPNFILNDVVVDPRNPDRILIATDRGGVFVSENGGLTFQASNAGFSHRQITSVVPDRKTPGVVYVSLVNDKEFGGVFVTRDGGQSWSQISSGLENRDIFDLEQSESGTIIAATNKGLYRYATATRAWQPINSIVNQQSRPQPKAKKVKGKLVQPKPLPPVVAKSTLTRRALGLDVAGDTWYAATDQGILRSENNGQTWSGGPVLGESFFIGVAQHGNSVAAITPLRLAVSNDGGSTWAWKSLPVYAGRVFSVLVEPDSMWVGSHGGALRSLDGGQTWEHVLEGLPSRNVLRIERGSNGALLATVAASNIVYVSNNNGKSWAPSARAGYVLRRATERDGKIWAATAFNGLVATDSRTVKASK